METNPTVPPTESNPDARIWNTTCHLIACTGYVTGLGFILGPLLVWLLLRERHPSVDAHGKESMNFQVTVFLATVGLMGVGMVIGFLTCGIGWYLAGAALFVLAAAHLVLTVMAGVQAWSGGFFRYPFIIRLLK